MTRTKRWSLLIIANALILCVLSFHSGNAAPQGGQQPFANPVHQREEMIRELREIKTLLRQQNRLLRGAAGGANETSR